MEIPNGDMPIETFKKHFRGIYLPEIFLKICLILTYSIIMGALFLIIITPPAEIYEFSIYDAYPSHFWILILVSVFFGQLCAIFSVLNNTLRKYWIMGFLASVIGISLVLFLPMILGYFSYGIGDVLTHIGFMKDIENSGSIAGNHYPGFHLFGIFMHEFTGLSFITIAMIVPGILSLIYILFWFILGREIFQDRMAIILLVLIATLPMVIKGLFTPNSLANLLIPFALFLMIKSLRNFNNYWICLLLIIFSTSMVFFHPLALIMTLFIFFLAYLYIHIFKNRFVFGDKTHLLNVIGFISIIFISWGSYLIMFMSVVRPLATTLLGFDNVESEFMEKSQIIRSVDIDILYFIKIGLYNYGVEVILGLSTLICISYLLYLYSKKKIPIHHQNFVFFSIICFIIFTVLAMTVFFMINKFNWERILKFMLIFSIIIVTFTISFGYNEIKFSKRIYKKIFFSFIVIILLTLIYFSIFNFHLSPLMKKSSQQVTETNYMGMHTFLENKESSIPTLEYGISQLRYYDAIYGRRASRDDMYEQTAPLDHFGYDTTIHRFGTNYDRPQYLLISEQGRGFAKNMYPEFPDSWSFSEQDFELLELDASTKKIYSNDMLEIYLTDPYHAS